VASSTTIETGDCGALEWGLRPPPRGFAHPERLALPLGTLPRVGPALSRKLRQLGLVTVGDLLYRRPRRYETAADEVAIVALPLDAEVAIAGELIDVRLRRIRSRLTILTCTVADTSGTVQATWFNQPWLVDQLQPGMRVRLRGRLGTRGFDVRSFDTGEVRATADYAPVYAASEQVSSSRVRELVRVALAEHAADVLDPLPAELDLPLKRDALVALHFPRDRSEAEAARERLAFGELVALQLAVARSRPVDPAGAALPPPGELVGRYRASLPFRLTPYQEAALREIDADLAREVPMRRLLQGDVGSGKTVVALYALLRAVEAGRQGALMVPTETLAEQHFLTIEALCARLGLEPVLLTGTSGAARVRAAIESGRAPIVVGTHALIQRAVSFADLAVAVVDEQHRFGVAQREALGELRPHILHMTATPIPRTLALTVFGDLAVTEIAKPPADRRPVITAWVGAERSSEAYGRLRVHLDAGRQAYVVCPLIETSETGLARAASEEAARLREGELSGYRVGLLHGRLKTGARREVMQAFTRGELDVLVATTVIEVGVDVPNATIMIVQEADRFGLAQLHQLRGRVGRSAEQSYCLLISRPKLELTESARARLEALVEIGDGFELAERDLELRGEGQLLGTRQSGFGQLRFARLRADRALLEQARELAETLQSQDGPWHDEADGLLGGADPGALA
jgi:ATP-dependent DNA helicase RecG